MSYEHFSIKKSAFTKKGIQYRTAIVEGDLLRFKISSFTCNEGLFLICINVRNINAVFFNALNSFTDQYKI